MDPVVDRTCVCQLFAVDFCSLVFFDKSTAWTNPPKTVLVAQKSKMSKCLTWVMCHPPAVLAWRKSWGK